MAKAWFYLTPKTPEEKAGYIRDQRQAVLRAFAEYALEAMPVFDIDIDFGHTDTQLVIPSGGLIRSPTEPGSTDE